MATDSGSANRELAEPAPAPPYVGALLRLCWQKARRHLQEAVKDAGFTDLQEAHFSVFSYPLPDGVKPSDLARRMHMSRQATNYLVGQLEELGYLERRAAPGGDRRLVYLTEQGWRVADTIHSSMRDLQRQWAEAVGPQRFNDVMEVLRLLAAEDQRAAGSPLTITA